MVALRARGLGTVWTTMYLNEQDAVAELLGLPDDVTQICLFPVAYTIGTDFKPTTRRYPARDIAYFDRYGHTRAADGAEGVVAEIDLKVKPEVVGDAIRQLTRPDEWRIVIEQVPGGSRVRVHGPGLPVDRSTDALDAVRHWLSELAQRTQPGGGGSPVPL